MSRLNRLPRLLFDRTATLLERRRPGARFHFVRDYRRLVRRLLADHPRDEAMSLAVGGDWDGVGRMLAQVVIEAGLQPGMALLDLGCGSGRLAHALSQRQAVTYLGLDVVPELLAYARSRCPPDYRFELNPALSLPAPDDAFDMVCAFSVLTHLLHEESFLYVRDAFRVLKPGGALVFSFLELNQGRHWRDFETTAAAAAQAAKGRGGRAPLNVFIEPQVIALWAGKLGFLPPEFVRGGEPGAAGTLGQSVAVLRKPLAGT